MSRDNKIDQFFKKHLGNTSESGDGWNIPSDDLWVVAQKKINQPIKKKKRRVLFWFLGLGTLICTLLFLKINEKIIINQSILQDNVLEVLEQTESQLSLDTLLQKVENEEAIVNKAIVANVDFERETPPLLSRQSSKTIDLPHKAKVNGDNVQQKRWPHELHSVLSNENNKELNVEDSINIGALKFPAKTTHPLPTQAIAEVLFIPQMNDLFDINQYEVITEVEIPSWQWEIGISHARYPANPFTVIDAQDIENNKFINLLSSSYSNSNFVVTKKAKGRLSLSSGIYFTQQKIDVAFGFDSLIYESGNKAIEDGIKLLANNVTNNNSDENELELRFFPSANILNGDSLELYGHLPIKLVAYQLPLIWNFHFGRKRLEYLLNVGFSLDFIAITVDELPVEVFKEGVLVGNDINFKALKKIFLGARLYLGSGLKYHFSEHVNASVLFKLEPYSKEFSRYELGVHYKF